MLGKQAAHGIPEKGHDGHRIYKQNSESTIVGYDEKDAWDARSPY